jgi:CubicO group peptidase (beta-lactamase class C family)
MQWQRHVLLLASLILIGGSSMVRAQLDPESSEVQTVRARTLTASDLETFLNQIIPQQLEAQHIPGATVAVVKDGRVLLTKGYGFADLEKKTPVIAEQTLFRTGSVAKLFTWTAIMQLVEQGKLNLNADINMYLEGFKIPATYPQPITLKHLLTHTAGFEDRIIGSVRQRAEDLEPLASFVAKRIPARVYPPGTVTAYSNYGATLAGYIVEHVSGMPYERYVEKNIFEPLQMKRSEFAQPPKAFAADMANGYTYSNGKFQHGAFEIMQIVPAGSLSTTASDMAHFVMAQLQGGEFRGKRILQPATLKEMQRQQFSNDPRVSGMAYGFYLAKVRGHRVLMHHGETNFFRTLLALLPDQQFGLYVAYNAPGGSVATDALLDAMLERYFPVTTAPEKQTGVAVETNRYVGQYLSTRTPRSTLEKAVQLFVPFYQPISVRANGQGLLEIQIPVQKSPSSWRPVGSGAFERSDGKDTLVFAERSSTMLFFDSRAPRGFMRLSWFDSLMLQPLWPIISGLGLVLAVILAIVAARGPGGAFVATHRGTYWLTLLSGLFALGLMIGLGTYVLFGFMQLLAGVISPVLLGLLTIGWLLIPLAASLLIFAILPQWSNGGLLRWSTTICGISSVALLVWLNHWKLLGVHL